MNFRPKPLSISVPIAATLWACFTGYAYLIDPIQSSIVSHAGFQLNWSPIAYQPSIQVGAAMIEFAVVASIWNIWRCSRPDLTPATSDLRSADTHAWPPAPTYR